MDQSINESTSVGCYSAPGNKDDGTAYTVCHCRVACHVELERW